jgi:hypothetical protein
MDEENNHEQRMVLQNEVSLRKIITCDRYPLKLYSCVLCSCIVQAKGTSVVLKSYLAVLFYILRQLYPGSLAYLILSVQQALS